MKSTFPFILGHCSSFKILIGKYIVQCLQRDNMLSMCVVFINLTDILGNNRENIHEYPITPLKSLVQCFEPQQ